MLRKVRRHWRRLLSVRARATLLLVLWVASVVLTAVHDDGAAAPERSASSASAAAPQRSVAAARLAASGPTLAAQCGGGGCHDPRHHHRPLARHDVTQCQLCAMLLERPAELPLFVFAPPATVHFVGDDTRALLSSSERCACALARGPPMAGALA